MDKKPVTVPIVGREPLQGGLVKWYWLCILSYTVLLILYWFGGIFSSLETALFWIPVVGATLHAVMQLGKKQGFLLLLLAATIGWAAEVHGLHYGTLFGSAYHYRPESWMLLGIPLAVPAYWAVFVYTGYTLNTSMLAWLGQAVPSRLNHLGRLLPLLVVLDGLAVTAIDLLMDPWQVAEGNWAWQVGGLYFGIPLGNFIGWFLVTATITAIFRTVQYFWPPSQQPSETLYVHAVVFYALILLSFTAKVLTHGLPAIALIGAMAMLPFIIVNLLLFMVHRSRT